jgi:hypothetical protein
MELLISPLTRPVTTVGTVTIGLKIVLNLEEPYLRKGSFFLSFLFLELG